MNLRVPWNAGNFLTSCKPVSFSRRTLHHGVSKYMICECWPCLQLRKSHYMGVAFRDLHVEDVMYMCVTRCAVDVYWPWLAGVWVSSGACPECSKLQVTSARSYDCEPGSCFLQIDLSVFPFPYQSSRQMSLFAEAAGFWIPCFRQFWSRCMYWFHLETKFQ